MKQGAGANARKELMSLRQKAINLYRAAVASAVSLGDRNDAIIVAKRKEALDLYKKNDVKSMEPIVKDLWKLFYPIQGAGENEKIVTTRNKIEDLQRAYESAGGTAQGDLSKLLLEYAKDAERQACWRVMPSGDQTVMAANHGMKELISPEEYRLVVITNLYRVMMGERALKIDVKLCNAARGHSKDMVEQKFFAHDSPVPGKRSPGDRASKAGTSCESENIYMGSSRGEDAFWGWFLSLGHHKNMLGKHSKIGVGNHQSHWTENF